MCPCSQQIIKRLLLTWIHLFYLNFYPHGSIKKYLQVFNVIEARDPPQSITRINQATAC